MNEVKRFILLIMLQFFSSCRGWHLFHTQRVSRRRTRTIYCRFGRWPFLFFTIFFQELFGVLEFKIVLILFYLNDIGMRKLQRLGLIIHEERKASCFFYSFGVKHSLTVGSLTGLLINFPILKYLDRPVKRNYPFIQVSITNYFLHVTKPTGMTKIYQEEI